MTYLLLKNISIERRKLTKLVPAKSTRGQKSCRKLSKR
jgi:hypothetical protein